MSDDTEGFAEWLKKNPEPNLQETRRAACRVGFIVDGAEGVEDMKQVRKSFVVVAAARPNSSEAGERQSAAAGLARAGAGEGETAGRQPRAH
jgi:hypothetical protein